MLYSMPNGSFDLSMAWVGNSFRVVVKNASSNEIIFLKVFHFQNANSFKDVVHDLKAIVATDLLFSDTYRKVTVGSLGRAELYPTVHYNKDSTAFFSQQLSGSEIMVAIPYPNHEMEFYTAFFPKAVFSLLPCNWIQLILPDANESKLFVHISNGLMQVAYARSLNAIRFFSTFEFKTAEDFAYYTNLVAVELGLDRNKTCLVMSGDVVKDSALFKMAYTYFQEVKFFEVEGNAFSRLFDAYPRHQNIDLFSL